MLRYTTLLLFSLGLTTTLAAQDLRTSLETMRERYVDSDQLHVVMHIQAYESDSATTPFFEQQAEVKKAGEQYFYRYENRKVLVNERVSLMVDDHYQLISCQPRDSLREEVALPAGANLDSLWQFYGTPVFQDEQQGLAYYLIEQPQGDIAQLGIWLDTQTLLVRKLAYHYQQGALVTIDFTTLSVNPDFEAGTFSEASYVVKDQQQWQPTKTYAHYQVTQ